MILEPVPGDVWAVNTGNALTSELIRVGEALEGEPGVANHVVGVSHKDQRGRWWGIEGRPGGFGWVPLAQYARESTFAWANSNAAQPRTDDDRRNICRVAAAMVGTTQYDWIGGILPDGLDALGMHDLSARIDQMWGWSDPKSSLSPGRIVCSSGYDWIYLKLGLPCPKGGEQCDPADWWAWNANQAWSKS